MLNSFHSQEKRFIGEKEWRDYRKFAFKDDMLKLTVGLVLGTSFNKVTNGISNDIVMPCLYFMTSKTGEAWRAWSVSLSPGLDIQLGRVAGELLDFFVVSVVLYLIYVKLIGKLKAEAPVISIKECPLCKEFIRQDALRCRHCGGNTDVTEGRSRVEDKGATPGRGDQERSNRTGRKNRNSSEVSRKPNNRPKRGDNISGHSGDRRRNKRNPDNGGRGGNKA